VLRPCVLTSMLFSLKLAIRTLKRSPGFAVLAIAILTLGIGATTAMFSITRTVLLKPLAYRDPQQLVTILFRIPSFSKQLSTIPVNAQHYELWRDHARTLQSVALLGSTSNIFSGKANTETVTGARVTANFFSVLGVQPALGRAFANGEDQAGRDRVVVVSDRFWRSELGGRPSALGESILLDQAPYRVIGIMSPAFPFPHGAQLSDVENLPEHADYWVPLVFTQNDLSSPMVNLDFIAVARLKPAVTVREAAADLAALEKPIEKRFPERIEFDPVVHPLQELMARQVRLPLIVLMSAVALVLLIVCINMMNFTLLRATARRREWALRLALGAGTRNVVSGAFVESLVISLVGGSLGSLFALSLLNAVRVNAPAGFPRISELALDPAALLFALGASIASALLFGLWPAWRSARLDPQDALQSSGRTMSEGRKGHRAGKILIGAEVALSTVLLLASGLLLRSFVAILDVNPGIQVQHLLTARINLPPNEYQKNSDLYSFYKRLIEKVSALPGVEAAGTVSTIPLTPEDNNNPVAAGDRAAPPIAQWPMCHLHSTSSGYFKAAGIPTRAGRPFEERDGQALEVVISDNLAARLWPGESAIGRPLRFYRGKYLARVVGVVGAVHASSLTEQPGMNVYFPDWIQANESMSLVVRTAGKPESVSSAIRQIVHRLQPDAAIPYIESMRQIVAESLSPKRFQLILLASFAVAALLLAALGIYGVVAFATGRRTSEIGIRMALGARPKEIFTAIVGNGLTPVLIGIVAGLGVSVALSRLLENLLFEVHALDPLIYLATPAILLVVAALACFLPARRAAHLNPVEALRHE